MINRIFSGGLFRVIGIACILVGALSFGCSSDESSVNNSTEAPPAAPAPVVPSAPSADAAAGQLQNTITWASVTGATSYKIYYKMSAGVTTSDTAIENVTSPYVHSGLTAGQAYYYIITAINAVGSSPASAEVVGTPTADVPAVVSVQVNTGLTVDVTFDDFMGTGVTTAANYTVSGSGKGSLANNPNAVALVSGKTYRLTWSTGEMFHGGDIIITVANAQNAIGSAISSANTGTHSAGAIAVAPTVTGLSNDSTSTQNKTWNWGCSEASCTYRYVINTSSNTLPGTVYDATTSASQASGSGTYYIHVQAKDAAGNQSAVVHASAVMDTTVPTATVSPVNGTTLTASSSIVITFSETMSNATIAITGTGAPGSVTKEWSTTTISNDTLTLTGAWVDGASNTIIINGNDLAGNALAQKTMTYAILGDGAVYVSDTGGNDSNAGTHDAPLKTLTAALTLAGIQNLSEVRVAKGTYSVSSPLLADRIMKGGYTNGNWTAARDLTENATVIETTDAGAGGDGSSASSLPKATVRASGSLFDGFTVNGSDSGQYTAAVAVSSYSGTLSHCFLNGGAGASASHGLLIWDISGGMVSDNTIRAGTSAVNQYGIFASGGGQSSGMISNNVITVSGGAGRTNAIGVKVFGISSVAITGNTITSGAASESYGLHLYPNASAGYFGTISGNTIHGGSGTTSYGMYFKKSSVFGTFMRFENNTVSGGSGDGTYGLYIFGDGGANHEPKIVGNKIHGGSPTGAGGTYCGEPGVACGVYVGILKPTIYNNTIFGGTGPKTYGLYGGDNMFTAKVWNNTINGGLGTSLSVAFYTNWYTTSSVENNIFMTSGGTTRHCLEYLLVDTTSTRNNAFKNCPTAFLRANNSNYTTIAAVEGQLGNAGSFFEHSTSAVNFTNATDPNDTWSNSDYSLLPTSSSNIKSGGRNGDASNGNYGFTTDIIGENRTGSGATGWSIGAFEQDG